MRKENALDFLPDGLCASLRYAVIELGIEESFKGRYGKDQDRNHWWKWIV